MRNNSAENQAIVLILSAAKAQDSSHMKLVDVVEVVYVKSLRKVRIFFLLLKGYFVTTPSEKLLRKIDANEMVGTLISNLELISYFNSVVADSSCKPSKEIQINLW